MFHERHDCRLCGCLLDTVLEFNPTPLANNYTHTPVEQHLFPLTLMRCVSCEHVQLLQVVDPEVLYKDYLYKSGASVEFTQHLRRYAFEVTKFVPNGVLVEIASNDGTMMKEFERLGFDVIGVDPAGDYKCLQELFTPHIAEVLHKRLGGADIIVANNVLAHVDDLHGFMRGVKLLLKPTGVFVFEVQDLETLLEQNRFDLIYHEHLSYFALHPLKRFIEGQDFEIFRVEHNRSQGGSLRVYARHAKKLDLSKLKIPENPVAGKKHVVAYGACAKTTGLITQTGAEFDFIVDDNHMKWGMYSPTGQQIRSPESVNGEDVYISAWNFTEEIKRKYPSLKYIQ